jgi:hypothetical protein
MSFLTLNGWAVGARSGSSRRNDEVIGGNTRAFDGTMLQSRRAIKGAWSILSRVLALIEKEALRGLLYGLGDHWPLSADPFTSDKGLVEVGTSVADFELATAADGSAIYRAKKFTQAVRPAAATTNLADNRDLDGIVFVVVLAATQANDAVNYINGAASRKITYTASGTRSEVYRQVYDPPAAVETFTCSCYVRGDGSTDILRLWLEEVGSGVGATVFVPLIDGVWQRVENITHTVTASGGALRLHVAENTIDSGAVFSIDGVQVEQHEYSTTWLDSPSARAAGRLQFLASILAFDQGGMTINVWTRGPNLEQSAGGTNAMIFVGDTAGHFTALLNDTNVNEIEALFSLDGGATDSILTYATTPWDGAWHMVTLVHREKALGSLTKRALYFDGVLVASDNPTTMPSLELMAAGITAVGAVPALGAVEFNGPLEDLSVMPYPAAPDQIAAWAAATQALPTSPRLRAEGDFTPRSEVLVIGEPGSQDYVEAVVDSAFASNSSEIEFRLREA